MEQCGKHSNQRRRGSCCMDIYQQLGRSKGPSVVGKVLLAFVLPVLVFVGGLILTEALVAPLLEPGNARTVVSFLIALAVTALCVQLIRVLTRKPINVEQEKEP